MGITYRAPTIPSYWEKVGVEGLVGALIQTFG